jgi:hypothetical protein
MDARSSDQLPHHSVGCLKCKDHYKPFNIPPVWQCQTCKLVWITELCMLQDSHYRGWRQVMEDTFGPTFYYVVVRNR